MNVDDFGGDETTFVVDEVSNIVKESIEQAIGQASYAHNKVNQWTSTIIEQCLNQLTKLGKPFKYIVTCVIMQKNGAGLHTSSSCYWDNSTDEYMSTIINRVAVISSNAANLCALIDVNDEKDFLQQFMSLDAVDECIQGGDTNMARVQLLCQKVIQQIVAGNNTMYDALCEYFLMRAAAYNSMHQAFTAIGSINNGACHNNPSSELLLLQEKVKKLTEELLHWRQSNAPTEHPSELTSIEELLEDVKSAVLVERNVRFTYDGLCPVEANATGVYPSFHWQEERWLERWEKILLEEDNVLSLPLPPLVLNEAFPDNVPIVICGQRWRNEFWMCGKFHSKVPASVASVNVQLRMTLTFTKEDNAKLTVDKQVIATLDHGKDNGQRLFTLYDLPFQSLSSSTGPQVANISIRRISPVQNWYYSGLAPRFGRRDGKFKTIDITSSHGVCDGGREWKKMLENDESAVVSLPPLVVILEEVAVCVYVCAVRFASSLQFYARFHPSTPENVKYRRLQFEMELHVMGSENVTLMEDTEVTLKNKWSDLLTFIDYPWSSVVPPIVSVSILPVCVSNNGSPFP